MRQVKYSRAQDGPQEITAILLGRTGHACELVCISKNRLCNNISYNDDDYYLQLAPPSQAKVQKEEQKDA